ncbi:FAD-dependent oxidoreductase [Actinomadura rudentiformis]|uniref:3-oxosteroid 1-dehydrogenase n=1 Tax=Actinomadura rudentiformis TaxID=359158 RepID=A0A6H9YJN6_9ACTN|nr:FAD-dependent oxidoreductase [Actinomadura rudentiformis]KAB2341585.1 FAD-dependent oxidoreductase [Actinomadura rudentiformis]
MATTSERPDETADVIVVGSGAAALTAAYTAAAGGLRTVVLEKTDHVGGTSAYSGAAIWLPGNPALLRAGVADTVEQGLEYFSAVVGDRTPADLQKAYVSTGPELVEFLERDPSVAFTHQPFPDYYDAPGRIDGGRAIFPEPLSAVRLAGRRAVLRPPIGVDQYGVDQDRETLVGGQALVARLLLALDATGLAELRTGVRMRSAIVRDGRAAGVVAETGGKTFRLLAERGVVLAAGGYECDDTLRQRHHGLPGASWTSSAPDSNTGDALAAALEVGAAIDLMDEAWWCPATLFPNGHAAFTLGLRGGVLVNAAGERFANESLPYDRLGHAMHEGQATGITHVPAWLVFDDRFDNLPAVTQPVPDPDAFRRAGLWRSAATLPELAELIDVPVDALDKTIARFNGFATTGVDEDFQRGKDPFDRFFGTGEGPNPCLVPVERAPFHAVQIVLGDLGTKGGVRTDGDGRALDTAGDPIPGLFAVGNAAASVAGHVYPGPGTPLGSGMVFGYRAALRLLSQPDDRSDRS